MASVRVKICGVVTPEIAASAAEAGADAIGLVLAPGRRQVTRAQVREIVAALPPFVAPVGVFVNTPSGEVEELARELHLSAVQLHGDEPPEACLLLRRFGLKVIKAIHVADRLDQDILARYRAASALLLDTKIDGLAGGTGRTFPWRVAEGLSSQFRIVIAGGLDPNNVRQALDILRPYGVDVTSGVETDGRKDLKKVRAFIEQVRRWERGR